MPYLFEKKLVADYGISRSRAHDLCTGLHHMHRGLCRLDDDNTAVVAMHGLLPMLFDFAKTEGLNSLKRLQELGDYEKVAA
jgi:hypothetical protein